LKGAADQILAYCSEFLGTPASHLQFLRRAQGKLLLPTARPFALRAVVGLLLPMGSFPLGRSVIGTFAAWNGQSDNNAYLPGKVF
jgi:hypothetical protein